MPCNGAILKWENMRFVWLKNTVVQFIHATDLKDVIQWSSSVINKLLLQLQSCRLNVLLTLHRMRHLMGLKELYFVRLGQLRDTRPKVYFIVIPPLSFCHSSLTLSLSLSLSQSFFCEKRTCFLLSTSSKVNFSCY